jgi:predicted anti-sigma-YlaC factor YlaD
MNCPDYRELVSSAQDGELAEPELTLLAKHLAECTPCRTYQAESLRIRERLRRWPDETPTLLRSAMASLNPSAAFSSIGRFWGLAAVLLLSAGLGFLAGRASGSEESVPLPARPHPAQERRIVYPADHEIQNTIVLESLDASRVVLR